ncbi:calmodulin-A-like [Branchiostoma floridae]|uniref:Calmodulin-A-like n=1 Tax=Branchiostoma floridae TaxID=7739 RepID=A0A9J7N883_BRAFL|nr:calmodulin-A-like [Branchiostoma floridae]
MAEQEKQDLKRQVEQFLMNDQDGSGTVTAQELIDFVYKMGGNISEEQKQEYRDWVKAVDTSGDGAVSVKEFLAMMNSGSSPLTDTFKQFDKDGSGYITKDEIRKGMSENGQELGDEELDEMMKEIDTDGDGKVRLEDFILISISNLKQTCFLVCYVIPEQLWANM